MRRSKSFGDQTLQEKAQVGFHLRSYRSGIEALEKAVADGRAALQRGDCREALAQGYYAARMAGFSSAHYFETGGWPRDPVLRIYRPKIRKLLEDFYDRCGCGGGR
jgi:hypothetical protein